MDVGGEPLSILTYIAEGETEDGKPSLRYISLLREGAKSHGLPEHWIAFLEGVQHAEWYALLGVCEDLERDVWN